MVFGVVQSAGADHERALALGFAQRDAWNVHADAPWWALTDIRDMLNLFHPLSVSQTGNAAGASREVIIPSDWEPPFALRFYCADDYFADPERHKPGQAGTESFFEHRFKQVLIDDAVIWERDVVDDNAHGCQTIFQVDITPYVTPGKPFKLTFRAFDKTGTLERNDRDVWFRAGTWYAAGDGSSEQPPRFHTTAWFADPVAGEQAAVEAAPPGARPHQGAVAVRHRARWPMPAPGEPMPSPAELELVTPAVIPGTGFPITCGVPLPPGALRDPRAVRLHDEAGSDLPLQARPTGLWPDGSIRWLLLNAIVPAGAKAGDKLRLHFGEGGRPTPAAARLRLTRRGDRLTINTGALRVQLGCEPGKLVDAVYLSGSPKPAMTDLGARMSILVGGAPASVQATWQRLEVVERGPVAALVELHGTLDTPHQHIGRFTFRLHAYAGLPIIQTNLRIFNDVKPDQYRGTAEDPPLEVSDLALVATVPGGIRGRTVIGTEGTAPLEAMTGEVSMLQDTADHFAATADGAAFAAGARAQGWIAVSGAGGSVQASVWRFWQQFPKSLAADGDNLLIGLFAPSEGAPVYKPRFGEAKRHDLWFAFSAAPRSAAERQALGLLADEPPRLFSADWFGAAAALTCLTPTGSVVGPRSRRPRSVATAMSRPPESPASSASATSATCPTAARANGATATGRWCRGRSTGGSRRATSAGWSAASRSRAT